MHGDFKHGNTLPLRHFVMKTCKVSNHLTIILAIVNKRCFNALQAVNRAQKVEFLCAGAF
jgi:hypothetical protein